MDTSKTLSPELLGADKALRRAAIKVKQEAERLGTPYVVAESKTKNPLHQNANVDNKR